MNNNLLELGRLLEVEQGRPSQRQGRIHAAVPLRGRPRRHLARARRSRHRAAKTRTQDVRKRKQASGWIQAKSESGKPRPLHLRPTLP
jgi:hypothetical protein